MVAGLGTFAGRYVAVDVPIDEDMMLVVPGPLQLAILSILWRGRSVSLNALWHEVCRVYKPVALTTVSATTVRLRKRGWVRRVDRGYYTASISREELIGLIAERIEQA